MRHEVFISYSNRDRAVADAVCARLERAGYGCWIAPRDIAGGEWGKAIVEGIRGARLFVIVLSAHANLSPQVNREVERAVSHGLPILPFRIEPVTPSDALEYFISNQQWLDAMTLPLEPHLDRLAGVVGQLLGKSPPAEPAAASPPTAPTPPPEPRAIPPGRPGRGNAAWIAGSLAVALAVCALGFWLWRARAEAGPAAIVERLGGSQIDETIQLSLDGRPAGGFRLDRDNPAGRIELPSNGGTALYLVSGEEHVETPGGPEQRAVRGSGRIELRPGARYCIRRLTSQGADRRAHNIWLASDDQC